MPSSISMTRSSCLSLSLSDSSSLTHSRESERGVRYLFIKRSLSLSLSLLSPSQASPGNSWCASSEKNCTLNAHTHMHTCTHAHMHTCTHTHTHTDAYRVDPTTAGGERTNSPGIDLSISSTRRRRRRRRGQSDMRGTLAAVDAGSLWRLAACMALYRDQEHSPFLPLFLR